jgi:transglutaminase-like putative cysteine protease
LEIPLPPGDSGTVATVREMANMIRKGSRHPAVRQLAVSIVYPYKTDYEKAAALFSYVQKNVSYVRDNAVAEMLHSPSWQISSYTKNGFYHGDCDDHVIFLGSMLLSVGYPVRLVVVRVGKTAGGFNHVYMETLVRNKWIPMDATKKDSPMGWTAPAVRMRRFPV